MRVTTYRAELDENLHNFLVRESSRNYSGGNIKSPYAIVEMMNTMYGLNRQAEEHMYMLALNTKCSLLGVFELAHGTVDSALCMPREILIRALLCGASSMILVHNHPSQDVRPSREDCAVSERIRKAGELVGVKLSDYIIVGYGYYSFLEQKQW